jgi:ribose 5-phosphate isomerase B
MRIAIASDHAGYEYKQKLIELLRFWDHEVKDFGTDSTDSVDYPVYIRPAAEAVATGEVDRAIVLGGSGNGEAMVANRIPGVRCALVWSEETARLARQHNNANAISIGERLVSWELVKSMLEIWLETPFEGGRHLRRIEMIERADTNLEQES